MTFKLFFKTVTPNNCFSVLKNVTYILCQHHFCFPRIVPRCTCIFLFFFQSTAKIFLYLQYGLHVCNECYSAPQWPRTWDVYVGRYNTHWIIINHEFHKSKTTMTFYVRFFFLFLISNRVDGKNSKNFTFYGIRPDTEFLL